MPNGARCLLVTWARDSGTGKSLTALTASAGDMPAELVNLSVDDGTRNLIIAIHAWTKSGEASVTFSAAYSEAQLAGAFQLFYMENAGAGTVIEAKTGASLASATCSLGAPLGTAANGVALFAAAGGKNSFSNAGTWSLAPDASSDQSVEAFLRIHTATYRTDGSALDPTLTIAQTNDQTAMVAVSIAPA